MIIKTRVVVLNFYFFLCVLTYTSLSFESDVVKAVLFISKTLTIILYVILANNIIKRNFFLLSMTSMFLLISLDQYLIGLIFLINVVIFAYKDFLDFNNLKWFNRTFTLSILFVFLLYYLGVLKNVSFYNEAGFSLEVRHSFGFFNPNPASFLIFSTLIVSLYIRDKVFFIINSILYFITLPYLGSRTYLYLLVLFFPIWFLSRYPISRKISNIFLSIILILLPFAFYFYIGSGDWTVGDLNLDALLSSRLYLAQAVYIENNGLSFFPDFSSSTLDPAYFNFIFKLGLISYYLIVAFIIRSMFKFSNGGDYSLCLVFLLGCFAENLFTGYVLLPLIAICKFIESSGKIKLAK
ncbi:hypothetical protein [Pectobacterium polaris]|uniref:hypothetical protein n=1 Tax=Pectobacterium polaris TaxID=2042057 RepID=UPI0015818346|nr:hypothetical protein [Pectobacterium polaris]